MEKVAAIQCFARRAVKDEWTEGHAGQRRQTAARADEEQDRHDGAPGEAARGRACWLDQVGDGDGRDGVVGTRKD